MKEQPTNTERYPELKDRLQAHMDFCANHDCDTCPIRPLNMDRQSCVDNWHNYRLSEDELKSMN